MATTSGSRSGQDTLVVRNRRLHFDSAQARHGLVQRGVFVLAIAGIATVVLLRNWLHARAVKRYCTLDMRRLRENRLATARDAI